MTIEELRKAATYKGNLIIKRGPAGDMIFYDLTHYFDEDMLEIGYTSDTVDPYVPVLFDPKRVWGQESLKSYRIVRIMKRGRN